MRAADRSARAGSVGPARRRTRLPPGPALARPTRTGAPEPGRCRRCRRTAGGAARACGSTGGRGPARPRPRPARRLFPAQSGSAPPRWPAGKTGRGARLPRPARWPRARLPRPLLALLPHRPGWAASVAFLPSFSYRYPERVRALLIVNPNATSTTQVRRDVIAHALASQAELDVVETRYRGHAAALAAAAVTDGHQLLFTLGGDGTVNEAVNGLAGGQRGSTGEGST